MSHRCQPHTLCFECFRSEVNRARARRLSRPPESPFARHAPPAIQVRGDRQIAHRRRMLEHLERQFSSARDAASRRQAG